MAKVKGGREMGKKRQDRERENESMGIEQKEERGKHEESHIRSTAAEDSNIDKIRLQTWGQ